MIACLEHGTHVKTFQLFLIDSKISRSFLVIDKKDIMHIQNVMNYDGMCTMKIYRNRLTVQYNLFMLPIGSMYDTFTHILLIFMVNGGNYTVRPMDPSWVFVAMFPDARGT